MAQLVIDSSNATEYECHHFEAEASELGFPPGQFPIQIATRLGNKLDFHMLEARLPCGGVKYRQLAGCIELRVFND